MGDASPLMEVQIVKLSQESVHNLYAC
jgi:hypothetical protein